MQAVRGQKVPFTLTSKPNPGGMFPSPTSGGLRLLFDGVPRVLYTTFDTHEYVENGVLRRVLPPCDPTPEELEERARACQASAPPARVKIRVVGPNQLGKIAGALIRARGCGKEWSGTSDAEGNVVLELPPGDFQFDGELGGFQQTGVQLRTVSGTTIQIESGMPMPWPPTQGVRGRVVTVHGPKEVQPLPRVAVVLHGPKTSGVTAATDAAGRFEVPAPLGSYQIEVTVAGQREQRNVDVGLAWVDCGDLGVAPLR